jgi:penicillin amidase
MEDGYRGITMNMIMADDKGDIGYVMLASAPDRLSKIPYIGSRVLDGQSTKYDWKGLLPAKEYPRSINPSKGFIATANNR